MRQILAVLTIFFMSAGSAYAEESVVPEESTATHRGSSERNLNLSLALQFDSTMSSEASRSYYDAVITGRLRGQLFDRLTVDLALGLMRVDMELFRPSDMPFDAVLEMPWRAVIGGGARLLLYRWRYWDISLFTEIYFPLGNDEAYLTSAVFHDELAPLGLLNMDYIREQVAIHHRWYRAEFGVTIRGLIGRWRPFIDVKYVHLSGRLDLELQPDMEKLVDQLVPEISHTYNASFTYPYYALGFEVELGYGFELELRVAATPTLDDGWAFVGRTVLEIPLTAQARRNWNNPPPRRYARQRRG